MRWAALAAAAIGWTGLAAATEPCLPGFDDPLAEVHRSSGADLRLAATGLGTEDGAREIVIDVPGTPVAAWIYWVGEVRGDGGMPDDAISLSGGALAGPVSLAGVEIGRRHQLFSDEISGGCKGNGGEVAMRAEVPLDAFTTGTNRFTVSDFNEKIATCEGRAANIYRRQYGVEMLVVYEGDATCPAGAGNPGDDDSSDDRSSDDRSSDDASSDDHSSGKKGKKHGKKDRKRGRDDRSSDDDSGDDDSSDDRSSDDDSSSGATGGAGEAPCQREVIVLEGGDVASRGPFSREPDCGPQTSTDVVCFEFEPLTCDSTAQLSFGLGGTVPLSSIVGGTERLGSQEQTLYDATDVLPVTLLGTGAVLETNRLIDADFFFDGRKMSVFEGEVELAAGDDLACFQVELLEPASGEQAQHVILFDAALSLDRTCEAGGPVDPCDCDDRSSDDRSSDDGSSDGRSHGDRASDDDSGSDDDSSDDACSCDDDSSDDRSSDDD